MIARPRSRLFPMTPSMHRPRSQVSHHDASRTPSSRGASRVPFSTSGRDFLPRSSARSRSSAAALSMPTWSRPSGEHPASAEVRLTSEAEYREEEWGEVWTPPHQPPPHSRYPKLPSCWEEQRLCCNDVRSGRKFNNNFHLESSPSYSAVCFCPMESAYETIHLIFLQMNTAPSYLCPWRAPNLALESDLVGVAALGVNAVVDGDV